MPSGSAFSWCLSLARRAWGTRSPTERDNRRNQAACQMESRSWGNLTRHTGSTGPPAIGQIIDRPGHPVLHSAEQRFSGEMKGTPPERSHVPAAVHGLALSVINHAAAAGCRGNLPLGSLSFDAPASTFHSAARALLLLPSRIVVLLGMQAISGASRMTPSIRWPPIANCHHHDYRQRLSFWR